MLNELTQKHKVSFKKITAVSTLARSCIPNVGAAVSLKPIEFIPLVISWMFKTLEGQEFFKWLKSETFEPTLQKIIAKAGQLVQPYLDYEDDKPYEVLLTDYGFTLCEYWRARPRELSQNQFKTDLHQRLQRVIMGDEGIDHANYRVVRSERPNWLCVFTIGGAYQEHDLTFAININQHLFFDPRTGEFGCKTLLQLCEFVSDYLFSMYPTSCEKFFMYLLDMPTELQVNLEKISSNDKSINPKKSIPVT